MTVDPAKLLRVKAAMLDYFNRFPVGVSLSKLRDAVGEADASGEYMLMNAACRRLNICWWTDASCEFCAAITGLLESGDITVYPTSVLTYMVDGWIPAMPPLVDRVNTTVPYMHLHWVPVAFDLARAS